MGHKLQYDFPGHSDRRRQRYAVRARSRAQKLNDTRSGTLDKMKGLGRSYWNDECGIAGALSTSVRAIAVQTWTAALHIAGFEASHAGVGSRPVPPNLPGGNMSNASCD